MSESELAGPEPTSESPLSRRPRTILAGWICFILGMSLMFASLGLFFLYGPLFLATFILSIVGIAQRRVSAGVVMLVTVLGIPPLMWAGLLAFRVGSTIVDQQREARLAHAQIEFEDVEGYIDGNYMYLKGKIRNKGSVEVTFVKVGVEWLDAANQILDTDYTYAVGGEGLNPGAAKSFDIMTTADRRMKMFRYFVKD